MKITKKQLKDCIDRILTEKENQARFNNKPFDGMTLDEIAIEVNKRLGNEWEVAETENYK